MIRICIDKNNDKIKKITFIGHAEYADYGKDIVCAAVSSTLLCTVNALLSIDDKSIRINQDRDFVVEIKSYDDITVKLINNMIRCLESLEKQYPKNIKIK